MALHKRVDKSITTHNKFNLLFVALSVIAFEAIVLTLAIVPPATEYEVSLHDVYPAWFWIVMGLIILAPLIYLLVTHIAKAKWFSLKTAYWLLAVACTTSVLTKIIPLARGYYAFGAGDTHTHYGTINEILATGVNAYSNHYPFVHVDVALTSLFTDLSPELSALLLHTAIYAFSLLSFFLIGRYLFKNKKLTILFVSLTAIPQYSNEILSINLFGFWILFFFLYICCKAIFSETTSKRYLILAICYAVTIWYVHPETVLISSFLLFVIFLVWTIHRKINHKENYLNYMHLIIISLCLVMGWIYLFSNTSAFTGQVGLLQAILEGVGGVERSVYSTVGTSGYDSLETIILGFLLYGKGVLFPVAALIISLYAIHKIGIKDISTSNLILILLFISFSVLSLGIMVSGMTTGVNPNRLLKTVSILALLVIVYNINWLSNDRSLWGKLIILITVLAIIGVIVLGVGGLYGNSELNTHNAPIMEEDMVFSDTFFTARSDMYIIEQTTGRNWQDRFHQYLYRGTALPPSSVNIRNFVTLSNNKIAEHLGYDTSRYVGCLFDSDRYFALLPPFGDIQRIGGIGLTLGGINLHDVIHLNYDLSADKIQTSGSNHIYFIHHMK